MSDVPPSFVTHELHDGDEMISFVPEPDQGTRLRILRAFVPLALVLIFGLALSFDDRRSPADALGMLGVVGSVVYIFVHVIRLCRTSYAITSKRLMRFVAGRKIEDLELAACAKPFVLDLSKSDSLIARGSARFMSLQPIVRFDRTQVASLTLGAFLTSRDRTGMQIGYPAHDIPTPQILGDATRAWEAAQ
ncbi:hypothetical protein OEZ60_11295 [Defluviimonas sp. WL0024]|uniref:PH domain-containing protein n=1 Tax=Albidovulum salinarum TaxID=2984153 RepID=A0ABT2X3S6_9RHOB|nr:hypothetical protein [Defluviimonas sp. WL0024]MCU9848596.1 hypothetical protein [Defluviimonas sp. WL0024]